MDRCPADLRREAGEQQHIGDERRVGPGVVGLQRLPGEGLQPAAGCSGGEEHDSEQGDAEAQRGQDQVLPARLERPWAPAESDQHGGGGRGRLDEQPRAGEVAGERDGEEDCPEGEEQQVVRPRAPLRPHERAPQGGEIRGGDEDACEPDEPDDPDQQARGGVDDDPVAHERVPGLGEGDRRQCDRQCAGDERGARGDRGHGAPGREGDEYGPERRGGDDGNGERLAASHAAL